MAKRKRKGAPEVLWRLFGDRARTLGDTILALSPPPATGGGGGDEATSFLVRSTDDLEYRKFLSETFVVVSDDAPPPPPFDHRCRWSLLQLVRRTIEIIMSESRQASSNLISFSYDKESQSSPTVDELTSAKWAVLFSRVGDTLLVYLLKYTSIFLPLPQKKHHQICGCSIAKLFSNFPRGMPKSRAPHHPPVKRQRVERLV
ncbi:telomerase reverse transcriptase-like [Salvia splendens]|uniref:telomerase reverse transcriptase-like n=1 Tax=Salvia splendens TaxID=180675 RepID=UPI001C255C10|nr:telomerase reverse transcriptase-like [Salvia splendens]